MQDNLNTNSQQFFRPFTIKIKNDALRKSQSQLFTVNNRIQKEIAQGQTEVHQIEDLLVLRAESSPDLNKKRLQKIKQEKDMLKHKIHQMKQQIHQLQYIQALKRKDCAMGKSSLLNFSMSQSRIVQRKWKLSMHQRSRRIQSKRKQIEQRQKKRQQEQIMQKQKHKKSQEQRRKHQLKERIKNIQQRALSRVKQNQQSQGKLKTLVKSRKLFQKMSLMFKKNQNKTLIQMNKRLQTIKNSHKPLDAQQLKSHQQKLQTIQKQKSQLRLQKRLEIMQRAKSYQTPYQSVYYKRVVREGNQIEQSRCSLADSRSKIKQFAQKVRENIIPKIDKEKRAFIQQMKNVAVDNRTKEEKERERWEMIHNKGKQAIEFVRKLPKKAKENIAPIQNSCTKPKYQNYLTHSHSSIIRQKPWKSIVDSQKLSNESKLSQLRCEFEKLEQKQMMKKKKQKALKQNPSNDNENFDEEYMEMVRAKIEILNSIQ